MLRSTRQAGQGEDAEASIVAHLIPGDGGVGNERAWHIAGAYIYAVNPRGGHDIVLYLIVFSGPRNRKISGAHVDTDGEMLHAEAGNGVVAKSTHTILGH
jgi:hypothetical protein